MLGSRVDDVGDPLVEVVVDADPVGQMPLPGLLGVGLPPALLLGRQRGQAVTKVAGAKMATAMDNPMAIPRAVNGPKGGPLGASVVKDWLTKGPIRKAVNRRNMTVWHNRVAKRSMPRLTPRNRMTNFYSFFFFFFFLSMTSDLIIIIIIISHHPNTIQIPSKYHPNTRKKIYI